MGSRTSCSGAKAPSYEAEDLGPPIRSSRGMALLDLEADGTWEIAVANQDDGPTLWRRAEPADGSWIRFRLVDPEGNRDGLGARIAVTGFGAAQSRWVRAGGSYASDSERTVHFGLGSLARPAPMSVEVRWPEGATETYPGLSPNTTWLVRRGGAPIPLPPP